MHFLYLAFGHLYEPHGDPFRPSNAERFLRDMIVPTPQKVRDLCLAYTTSTRVGVLNLGPGREVLMLNRGPTPPETDAIGLSHCKHGPAVHGLPRPRVTMLLSQVVVYGLPVKIFMKDRTRKGRAPINWVFSQIRFPTPV